MRRRRRKDLRPRGSDRDVYVIDDDILKVAFQDGQKFRDPRLTDLEADQVDRVIIRRADGQIELAQGRPGVAHGKNL